MSLPTESTQMTKSYLANARESEFPKCQEKLCKVAPEPWTNTDVYGVISGSILWREVVEPIA